MLASCRTNGRQSNQPSIPQAKSRHEQAESSFYSAKDAFGDVLLQLEAESTGPGEQQRKADETHKVRCSD